MSCALSQQTAAINHIQQLPCGQTVSQLRADIIGTPDDTFRADVLAYFDEFVSTGRTEEMVNKAKARSLLLARITTRRAAERRQNGTTKKRSKAGGRRARLNIEHCEQIKKLLAEGMTRQQIGERSHVTGTTISRTLQLEQNQNAGT
jgi:DNA-binding NarL/FixJ family response regulator